MTLQNIFSNKPWQISNLKSLSGILLITNRSENGFKLEICYGLFAKIECNAISVTLKGVFFKRTSKKHFLLLTHSFAILYRR